MWDYSSIEDNFKKRTGNLDKKTFNFLRQEIDSVRFYSKCLDGSSYVYSDDLSNIYDLSFRDNNTYKIDSDYSSYYSGGEADGVGIGRQGNSELGFYTRYKSDYGYTVKNLFSPKRLFSYTNYFNVDIASTAEIDFEEVDDKFELDGEVAVTGQRILVKDNVSRITLNSSINAQEFLNTTKVTVVQTIGGQVTYEYANSENGIYRYDGQQLIREDDLDTVEKIDNYSVYVKLGTENGTKSFHLDRLTNGVFPLVTNNEPVSFTEKNDYVIRNSIDYRNVLDNNFSRSLAQLETSFVFNGESYTIPNRNITVGDFGLILNYQNNYMNIVKNRFKEDLKDIVELDSRYLIAGNNGTLLSMDKVYYDLSLIEIDSIEDLLSIDIRNKKGIITGSNGSILTSIDNENWVELENPIENNINAVRYFNQTKANYIGNNGVFGEININNEDFRLTEKKLMIRPNLFDERIIRDDLYNINNIDIENQYFKYEGTDYVDIPKDIKSSFSFDFSFKPTDLEASDNQVLFSITPVPSATQSAVPIKGFKVYVEKENNDYRLKLSITNPSGEEVKLDGDISLANNKWYKVFVTRFKNEFEFFVNGRLGAETDAAFDSNFDNFNSRIRLGAEIAYDFDNSQYLTASYNHFHGVIDNVRLWDQRLDNQEVGRYGNFYSEDISNLVTWYKFKVTKNESGTRVILTNDVVDNRSLILPPNSNITAFNQNPSLTSMIEVETFKAISITGDNVIAFDIVEDQSNYSDIAVNTQFYITFEDESPKNLEYYSNDQYYYGTSDQRTFRIDSFKLDFNLLNYINDIPVELEPISNKGYDNLSINENLQELLLIGSVVNNEIDKIDLNNVCVIEPVDRLANSMVLATVSTINTTNSIDIENDYKDDVTDDFNTSSLNYIKALGFPSSTQSVFSFFIPTNSGQPFELYKEVYLYGEIEDQLNGFFEVSFNGVDFEEIKGNGEFLVPLGVGAGSSLTFRTRLNEDAQGNKVKGLIKNLVIYDNNVRESFPRQYTGTDVEVRKLYFSQFDKSTEIDKITASNYLYSYIDAKSLQVNNVEQLDLATYSAQGFPARLFQSQVNLNALVNCQNTGLCSRSLFLTNDTIDRIQYGFGLTLSITGEDYVYNGTSYNLLEPLTINNLQLFGVDDSEVGGLNNPYHVGFDVSKDFYFEVDSVIITEDDLLNSDITGGSYSTQSIEFDSVLSLGSSLLTDEFNKIVLTGSLATYSLTLDETLDENAKYLLELELDGDVNIVFGTNSVSLTGSNTFLNEVVQVHEDLTEIEIKGNANSTIRNLVITERVPTKSFIRWDKDNCDLSYKLNGVSIEEGFIQSDGDRFLPTCELQQDCDITIGNIVNTEYWEDYDPKLLFLNYDIANKLYFFDLETGEYQLPQDVVLTDIRELTIQSIDGEKSWLDYARDVTKEFVFSAIKSDGTTVPWSNSFVISSFTNTYNLILNGNSTSDLSDINGTASGLLPNYATGSTISIGAPPTSSDVYLYGKIMVIKIPSSFDIEIGDVINFNNSLINTNLTVIEILNDGDTYAYFRTGFDDYLINRLTTWTKTTSITNLNRFQDTAELIERFNIHPISVGYTLTDLDNGTRLSPKYNFQTAYYNLQCNAMVRNNDLITTDTLMQYRDKVTLFDYSPNYNILSYLLKDSRFTSDLKLRSLPEYRLPNNNSGALYTLSTGEISFNTALKAEWESIPIYTFIDLVYESTAIRSVLVMSKNYDATTDRYIIKTYDYYDDVIQQSSLDGDNFTLRVRNTLAEISEDLKKLDNIQRVESPEYDITDLNATIFSSYTNLKSDLNFKPYTDSYAKAFLSQKEFKEYLSGIVYTDFNNNLAMNIVNLTKDDQLSITGIGSYYIDCPDCVHDDFISFGGFNQFSIFGSATSSTNRVPFETYGYNNQIQVFGATGATFVDIPLSYGTQSGTSSRVLEFDLRELKEASLSVFKGASELLTLNRVTNEITKVQFTSDSSDDLFFRLSYDPENRTIINDIRVGDIECLTNCFLTALRIPNHGLEIGDEFTVRIEDDVFELQNLYESNFEFATESNWVQNVNNVETSIPLLNGQIEDYFLVDAVDSIYVNDTFTVTPGDTYRISFDYSMIKFGSATPSLNLAFGASASPTFSTVINELSVANNQRVETNFIATTSSITFGFNVEEEQVLTIRNIRLDRIVNQSKYYDGRQVVFDVVDNDNLVIDIDYIGDVVETSATFSAINPCGKEVIRERITSLVGTASFSEFDPYLNYEPIDVYKLGNDNQIKYPTEVNDSNWNIVDEVVSITGIDNNPFRFRLIDSLTFNEILDKYPWVLEAEIRDAVIGEDANGLVWYKGTWDCGRWLGGTWYSGIWKSGVWYNGTFFNSRVSTDNNSATIDVIDAFNDYSIWKGGTWFNGTKKGGRWESGEWFDGTWEKGDWLGGTWRKGTWKTGNFKRGNWFDGLWTQGTFNSDFGLSRWFDGTWLTGDFENGIWFKGRFESTGGQSTFGNRATLSRKAIWENGFMVSGTVNSGDNTRHDLTVWKTGRVNFLLWNGGTMFQNNINNCVWQDGVVKDIDILAFYGDTNGNYYFIMEGAYRFDIGDNFWVINNDTFNPIYGSDTIPNRYTVDQDHILLDNGRLTKVFVSNLPNTLISEINTNGSYVEGFADNNNPVDTQLQGDVLTKLVSNFSKTQFFKGRVENCIFDDRFIRSVYWENGYFKSGDFGF